MKENKEKKRWETKGYEYYQSPKVKKEKVSDYQFNILERRFNLKNLRILEIGVGSGRDMKRFEKAGAKLFGLDISSKFIEDIKKEFDGKFYAMDARDISNLKVKNLDLIYSRWSLFFLKYKEFKSFLKDSKKVLAPNGKIMISLRAGDVLKNINKNSKIQSIQLNAKNVQKSLPFGMEIEFLEIIDYKSTESKSDKQITFIISNKIYKASRNSYLK